MTLISPPKPGEDVNILAPHASLRGHVTGRTDDALTVQLEQTAIRRPFKFAAGAAVEVEWLHALGVVQLAATVGSAVAEPHPTLVLRFDGSAEPIERRGHERVQADLAVSAWSPSQPTRRLEGRTVDISTGGALLHLPDLSPLVATLQVRIDLPRGPITVETEVRWRREPGLAGVQFLRFSPESQAALVDYLRAHR